MTSAVGVWSADKCEGRIKGTSIIVEAARAEMEVESVLNIARSINRLSIAASNV